MSIRMRLLASLVVIAPPPALAAQPPHCALVGPLASPAEYRPPVPASAIPYAPAPGPLPAHEARLPFIHHLADAGAHVIDLGAYHGLRTIAALNGDQFMVFQVTPDGEAAVSGAITELTPAQLGAIAAGHITQLGTLHGLNGLFVRDGQQFQVFYETPDQQGLIPGVLWDATGKDLTRKQVGSIPGVIPTVVVGSAGSGGQQAPAPAGSALALIREARFGTIGSTSAPHLWMLIDPQCIYSIRALQMLEPYVANSRLRLSVVPVSVLDYEDKGQSTRSADALLSMPSDKMVAAWQSRDFSNPLTPDGGSRLLDNTLIAQRIGLKGTPTFLWEKPDGTEGRIDGLPDSVPDLLSSIGG